MKRFGSWDPTGPAGGAQALPRPSSCNGGRKEKGREEEGKGKGREGKGEGKRGGEGGETWRRENGMG